MKKILFSVGITILILMIIGILLIKQNFNSAIKVEENFEMANIINSNSYLPIKYMSKYEENSANFKEYEKTNNYMSIDFYSKDRDIVFKYYGYPNDESEYYLGEISISTSEYNILGVAVGDRIEPSIKKLNEYGFELDETDTQSFNVLNYEDYTVELITTIDDNSDEIIEKIQLRVNSKYLGRNMY